MRSNKHYTNVNFTHRVDHDGGRHRSPRSLPEPSICKGCNCMYLHRRWTFSDHLHPAEKMELLAKAHQTLCPACRQEDNHEARGFFYASGQFLEQHHGDIMKLLFNEAERASEDNPMSRILDVEEVDRDWIAATTTTEHLAQRLGHALNKAYGGDVYYNFSHENKLSRVYWHRD